LLRVHNGLKNINIIKSIARKINFFDKKALGYITDNGFIKKAREGEFSLCLS